MRSFRFAAMKIVAIRIAAIRIAMVSLAAMLAFGSCAGAVKSHSMLTTDGASLKWTPEQPRIGDSVAVEAFVPMPPDGKDTIPSLPAIRGSDGSVAEPLSVDWYPDRVLIRWSFRVKKAGNWVWASTGTTLWSVASVAGSATELKKIDPGTLWTGRN